MYKLRRITVGVAALALLAATVLYAGTAQVAAALIQRSSEEGWPAAHLPDHDGEPRVR